jgi:biotin-dependent carboxylase-like uncharacterized protein
VVFDVSLKISESGLSCIQDLGRHLGSRFGFPVGGSADQYSARCANALVGNPFTAPVIEITASGLTFVPDSEVLVSITGGYCDVDVDGVPRPQWSPVVVQRGQTVRLSAPRVGVRTYLGVNGTLVADTLLGSVSPDLSLGNGRYLQPGDVVTVVSRFRNFDHPYARHPLLRPRVRPLRLGQPWTVRMMPGPDWLTCDGPSGWLFKTPYVVGHPSNSVGLRLEGSTSPSRPRELVSRGVPIGAIEMPSADEGLLLLLRGRMLTAGYPVPGVVASVDHSILGQVGAGEKIVFTQVTRAEAVRLRRTECAELHTLAQTVKSAFLAAGVTA